MNFLADEGIDKQIVERLRQEGHAVLYVAEMGPSVSDEQVLDRANENNALLITADKDFGEMIFHQDLVSIGGVILLRLAGLSAARKAEIVSKVIEGRGDALRDSFSVISPGKVRIRQRP